MGFGRLLVICEGQTEQEFGKRVLRPFFNTHQIEASFPTLKHSGGGMVPWKRLKEQIENHLKEDNKVTVTTFLDYYGLRPNHNLPGWESTQTLAGASNRIDYLQEAMSREIQKGLRDRFVPYFQQHEFEALLFSDLRPFCNNFDEQSEFKEFAQFQSLFQGLPEEINDGKSTAPSKRLLYHVDGYDKIIYGSLLAEEMGLDRIRKRCPRFDGWINLLLVMLSS